MNKVDFRRIAVCLGVAAAVAAPASQALTGWGLSASEFASQGDGVLRVAGYAFSIWGVLYAGLAAYALRRIVQGPGGPLEAAVDGPLAAASLGCGLWIVAAGLDLRWLTVLVIGGALAAALIGLFRLSRAAPIVTWRERLSVLWPLALLAGWLTAASVVNVLTVLTMQGHIAAPSPAAALVGVLVAGAIAIATLFATRVASYALPVGWGLGGAYAAEVSDQPAVGYAALGCAGLVLICALFVRRRRGGRAYEESGAPRTT